MQFSEDAIKRLITTIGYTPQDGKSGIYFKSYQSHDGYCIFVDFNNQQIIYDSDENPSGIAIKVWERTTSNFSKSENFVVLECVDSLLEKGYAPSCIELEKTYPSGHGRSGKLDILVKSADDVPFLMIECKTWGAEFDKEQSKMLKNGGQLFTYYANDRATEFLCLYASQINDTRERKNIIVDVGPAWASLSGVREIFEHWNKNFKDNGIFDSYAAPYDVKHRALTYGKLETLKEEHSGKIYNQIMEILRHNAISDKPNAFNKLLNLFVCKIIDETDKNPEDELEFQWLESDTDESLQLRLNDLYKKGMWRFLEIKIIDYEQREVSEKLANIEDFLTKQWIMKMYTDTRLKKSPNFAFVEVQDDRTFALNAQVVREIVELLQAYKFRYEQKHEFLGNFFELLLNTSMKQEAGQFFTPVPITRFIISSLPLAELVQKRVNERQGEPLPTVIDFACGSGHFLTEYMAQMQEIIDSKIDIYHTSPRIKNLIQSWQGFTKFLWAKDYVYGIDLDNRLVKTTKVSAFFNGDGEANIVWANGLDSFTKSEVFRGKLVGVSRQDNGKFDILISNPPYSVDAFKSTIKYGEESFELYSGLTDNSSEIECLFVERMKQLLKVGGWAAVILPSSILTNSGIHARAREILLKYFKFKAIVELGPNTFMKTGTNTVILFLERRSNDDYTNISRAIDRFFTSYHDVTVSSIENAFSVYVANVYDRLAFEDYISLFNGTSSEAAKAHELYEDYMKTFGEDFRSKAIEVEKEKLLYFLLTYNQTIVLVKTGKGKEEKKFLGYEFSERRGHEGLHWLSCGTNLYDDANPLSPQKASSYIYRIFLGKKAEIDPSMEKNVFYGQMCQFIEYRTSKFDKVVNLGKQRKLLKSEYPQKALGELCEIKIGGTPSRDVSEYFEGNNLWVSVSELNGGILSDTKEKITDDAVRHSNVKLIPKGTTLISFKLSLGKTAIAGCDLYTNEAIAGLLPKDGGILLDRYLFYLFNGKMVDLEGIKGDNIFGKSLNSEHLKNNVKIPLPPLDIQQKIVAEMERVESQEKKLQTDVVRIRTEISAILEQCQRSAANFVKLREVAIYSKERTDAQNLNQDTYVGVDNLLPDVAGKRMSDFVPISGTVTAYHPGNILLSNIRPYLKKAWLADNHGGASGDVLVLVVDEKMAVPGYVFSFVSTDQFFDYEMQNIGSKVKMPRADKKKVLDFQIPILSIQEQQRIAGEITSKKSEISKLCAQLSALKTEKDSILQKYL